MDDSQTFTVDDLTGIGASAPVESDSSANPVNADDFPILHRWLSYEPETFDSELESLAALAGEPELASVKGGIEAASVALTEIYAVKDVLLQ